MAISSDMSMSDGRGRGLLIGAAVRRGAGRVAHKQFFLRWLQIIRGQAEFSMIMRILEMRILGKKGLWAGFVSHRSDCGGRFVKIRKFPLASFLI